MEDEFLEGYYALAENYITQGHIAFCGLGSLTMALNTLLVDPKRIWQGVWRWFDESMLDCCVAPEEIKVKGVPLPKLACLARCNGACCTLKHADAITEEEFRRDVVRVTRKTDGYSSEVIILSYSRPVLNQSGNGHFSPLGAYNGRRDMVLIMDVARFKYPAHWVPLKELYKAMMTIDEDTGLYRGYLILSRGEGMDQTIREACECTVTGEPSTILGQSESVSIDFLDPDAIQARIAHFAGHQCGDCCGRTSC